MLKSRHKQIKAHRIKRKRDNTSHLSSFSFGSPFQTTDVLQSFQNCVFCFVFWVVLDSELREINPSENIIAFHDGTSVTNEVLNLHIIQYVSQCVKWLKNVHKRKVKLKLKVFRDNCILMWSSRSRIKQLCLTAETKLISVHLNTHWQLNLLSKATEKENQFSFMNFGLVSSINKSRDLKALP